MVLGLRLLRGFEIYVAFWVSLEIMFIIITTLLTCHSVNAINHQELVIKIKQANISISPPMSNAFLNFIKK